MTDTKHEAQGLEVVAWQDAENPLYTTGEKRQMHAWATDGYPIVELVRLSDATAVIDQLREQLEWVKAINGALDESNKRCLEELAALKSAPAVMSERCRIEGCLSHEQIADIEGWNDCLDESESLNRGKTNEQ